MSFQIWLETLFDVHADKLFPHFFACKVWSTHYEFFLPFQIEYFRILRKFQLFVSTTHIQI